MGKSDLIVFAFLTVAVLFGLLILGFVLLLVRRQHTTSDGKAQVQLGRGTGREAAINVCPLCAGPVKPEAVACGQCGHRLAEEQ